MAPRTVLLTTTAAGRVATVIKQQQGSEEQEAFATRLGVSVATVRRLSRGVEVSVQARMLEKMSEKFGWPADTLERVAQGEDVPSGDALDAPALDRLSRLEAAQFRLISEMDQLRTTVQELLRRVAGEQ